MRYPKYLIIFLLLFIGNIALSDNSLFLVDAKDIVPSPLEVGEKLTYNISLKKLPAGKRTDWIVGEEVVNGANVYRIQSEMKTRALFRFYKFRNQQETHLNPTTLSPIRFQNYVQDRNIKRLSKLISVKVRRSMKRSRVQNQKHRKNARQKSLKYRPARKMNSRLSTSYVLSNLCSVKPIFSHCSLRERS